MCRCNFWLELFTLACLYLTFSVRIHAYFWAQSSWPVSQLHSSSNSISRLLLPLAPWWQLWAFQHQADRAGAPTHGLKWKASVNSTCWDLPSLASHTQFLTFLWSLFCFSKPLVRWKEQFSGDPHWAALSYLSDVKINAYVRCQLSGWRKSLYWYYYSSRFDILDM